MDLPPIEFSSEPFPMETTIEGRIASEFEESTNPFLDSSKVLPPAKLAFQGKPLSRIIVPEFKTLIHTAKIPSELATVKSSDLPNVNRLSQIQTVKVQHGAIQIDVSTFGISTNSNINPIDISIKTGKILPRDYHEAYNKLAQISPTRSGKRNDTFNIQELRQIAKNLGLHANGNKDELATRIIDQVRQYFKSQ